MIVGVIRQASRNITTKNLTWRPVFQLKRVKQAGRQFEDTDGVAVSAFQRTCSARINDSLLSVSDVKWKMRVAHDDDLATRSGKILFESFRQPMRPVFVEHASCIL